EPSDQERVGVLVHVTQEASSEGVQAEAPETLEADPRERESWSPRRRLPEEKRGDGIHRQDLRDDRPGSEARDRKGDRYRRACERCRHRPELELAEVHGAHEQRALDGSEARKDEAEGQRRDQRLHLAYPLEPPNRAAEPYP